jgi:hypothetical protein
MSTSTGITTETELNVCARLYERVIIRFHVIIKSARNANLEVTVYFLKAKEGYNFLVVLNWNIGPLLGFLDHTYN